MLPDTAYVARLQQHLADYREHELGAPAGVWGDPPREYGHILPRSQYELNIVEPLRAAFWHAQANKSWKLHRFFHHLTSSQAFAFNLFFPVYPEVPPAFAETRRVLGIRGNGPASVDFEMELPSGDGTNIDVMITDDAGRRTVIEVKLTEASFGRASNDYRHQEKLTRTYLPLLRGRISDSALEPTAFFSDYQLYRNLAQIRPQADDRVVLLLPRARAHLWGFANGWCEREELGVLRERISVVAMEDLLATMLSDAQAGGIDRQPLRAVERKYFAPAR